MRFKVALSTRKSTPPQDDLIARIKDLQEALADVLIRRRLDDERIAFLTLENRALAEEADGLRSALRQQRSLGERTKRIERRLERPRHTGRGQP